MILDENWVLLGATEILLQRQGTGHVALCYATATPTTEEHFSLGESPAMIYPIVSGKSLYARSVKGGAITFEAV